MEQSEDDSMKRSAPASDESTDSVPTKKIAKLSFSPQPVPSLWEAHVEAVGSMVVPFLGVRSLARLGTTHKGTAALLQPEIKRRRAAVEQAEKIMATLLQQNQDTVPSHFAFLIATRVHQRALRLIDDELDWQIRFENYNAFSTYHQAPPRDPWFSAERQMFLNLRRGGIAAVGPAYRPSALWLLPDAFYVDPWKKEEEEDDNDEDHVPSKREVAPSKTMIDLARQWVRQASTLDDHRKAVLEVHGPDIRYVDRQEPLFIFLDHDPTPYFENCHNQIVEALRCNPPLFRAFQMVARKVLVRHPTKEDALHLPLFIVSQQISNDSEDEYKNEFEDVYFDNFYLGGAAIVTESHEETDCDSDINMESDEEYDYI